MKDIEEAVIEANKEYQIAGVPEVSNVKFLNSVEGGTYWGSYIFLFGRSITDMYFINILFLYFLCL